MPSPIYKIFRRGEYVASCKYPEDAAAICGMTKGTEVKLGHSGPILFREGSESISAAESWDEAAKIMRQRQGDYIKFSYWCRFSPHGCKPGEGCDYRKKKGISWESLMQHCKKIQLYKNRPRR